jgi:transcriptional/translational regulatory protein YebC/TACO1
MLDFLFDRKCSFQLEAKEGINLEELELELIDYGVEEIFAEDDTIMVFAEFTNFGPIQKHLEENEFNIKSFRFERIPTETKELTDEQQADVEKLLDKLDDDEDVTNVFHNMH